MVATQGACDTFSFMNAPVNIVTTPEKARLRVEDFLLLEESGAFADYRKSELIDGEIYLMNAQHSWHARTKSLLTTEFNLALRDLEAWCEVSTRVSDYSLPEPDIVLTRYRERGFVPLETVALLVEVSDTTLSIDLGRKKRIYAEAGIAEYWVIDLNGERAIRMWQPKGKDYARMDEVALGGEIASVTIAGLSVPSER
jgi:Uma2 family endonuclease